MSKSLTNRAKSNCQRIERAIARDDWKAAEKLITAELAREPDSHWLLTRMSCVRYEQRNYMDALAWSDRAMNICPRCPLVLWDRAGALEMLGHIERAEAIWRSLLRRGAARLARHPCGESIGWSKSVVNDARYRLACAAIRRNDDPTAKRLLRAYLHARTTSVKSIYSATDASRALRSL